MDDDDLRLGQGRRAILQQLGAFLLLVIVVVVVVKVAHPEEVWRRIEGANPWWLIGGIGFEVLSFVGYIALFRGLFVADVARLGWGASTEITLAGVVATRLLAAAGAGGIALTSWALHAAGMGLRETGRSVAGFLALLYASYFSTLIVSAILLLAGVPSGISTAIAVFGLVVGVVPWVIAMSSMFIPGSLERRLRSMIRGEGRVSRLAARVASVPTVLGEAVSLAVRRTFEEPRLFLWSLLWWVGDVAVLVATFAAFGDVPNVNVIVFAYFLGHVGNALPIPGGVGGTEGGMIGAFAACGVDFELALVATLTYQAISVWLPVIPGVGGFVALRRRVRGWRAEDAAVQAAA